MRKWLSEIGEAFRKSLESQPKYWFVIVVSLVSSVGGGAIVLFVVLGNELGPGNKFDVFVELLIFLLTLLAVLGYGIYTWIGNKLESRLEDTWDKLESRSEDTGNKLESRLNEGLQKEQQELQKVHEEIKNSQILFRIRLQRNMGYLFWQLYEVEKKKGKNKSTLVSQELIKFAIKRAKESFDWAKKLPENEYKDEVYKCKSNWVYFLAEAAVEDCELTMQVKEQALLLSSEILEEISKQDYPSYYQYHESCAWALQHLSEAEDKFSKQKASDIIRELLKNLNIPFSWREMIEKKWVELL